MARARNIKPGFFRNADLAELSYEARLLFIGLWTIADRCGRMEDRPKQIKMELFPADNLDIDALLDQLASIGMVARYSHDGKRYLHVVNFEKHQNPHKDEKASTIPDRDGNLTEYEPNRNKHSANTMQAPCKSEKDTVAIGLIPDSLIPDSLNEEAKASLSSAKPSDIPPCPHKEIIEMFCETLPTLPNPKPELWSGARAKHLAARWKWVLTAKKTSGARYAESREEALDFFKRYFGYVATCPHLLGENQRGWTADLGWLVNDSNFAKVLQGNYERQELQK